MENTCNLFTIEKRAMELTINNYYKKCHIDYNKKTINNIMWNAKEHIVSLFKDYLIFDELAEFFIAYYPPTKSIDKLKDLFSYYNESSFIFPNYTPLPEAKYIYRSIIRKQRVIDEQEDLEELKIKQEKLKEKRKNIFFNFYNDNESQSRFFNSTIYNSILKSSESLLKILFGIDNKANINKKNNNNSDYLNKNFINHSNGDKNDNEKEDDDSHIEDYYNIDNFEEIEYNNQKITFKNNLDEDIDDIEEIDNIIKIIHKYESKKITNVTVKKINENNNNNNKMKIKLGFLPNRIDNISNYNIIKTDNGKIGKNILNNYKTNNFFKNFKNNGVINTTNISSNIKQNKNTGLFYLKNNEKRNIDIINFKSKTRADIKENLTNSEINNPFIITNYNNKSNNFNKKNNINNFNQKHKKVKSTFCFNESNNNSNNDYLIRINGNDKKDNYINYYRNEYNTPTAKRTQTLNKNINDSKQNKKVDKSIININININETNLFMNNPNKNNYYKKNNNYPKIIPKLDINAIKKKSNSIRNKISEKTIGLKDLNHAFTYKNNNFTERNLIQKRQTPNKNQKINNKFKLMLGLQTNNKKIIFKRKNNDCGRNNIYLTENNTLRVNNNNIFNKKILNNDTNQKKSKSNSKNKVLLTESLTKLKISDYYTDRNKYLSIK